MAHFRMAVLVAVLTELLKILQRNVMPAWPRFLTRSMVIWWSLLRLSYGFS